VMNARERRASNEKSNSVATEPSSDGCVAANKGLRGDRECTNAVGMADGGNVVVKASAREYYDEKGESLQRPRERPSGALSIRKKKTRMTMSAETITSFKRSGTENIEVTASTGHEDQARLLAQSIRLRYKEECSDL